MSQDSLPLTSFAVEALPAVYKPLPLILDELFGEDGVLEYGDACTLDRDDEPIEMLIISPKGVLVAENEDGFSSSDEERLEVTFHPWSEVEAVRLYDTTVQVQLKNRSRPSPSADVYEHGEEATEEQARTFWAQAVRWCAEARG